MKTKTKKRRNRRISSIILVAAIAAMILSYFAIVASAGMEYTITDGSSTIDISSKTTDIDTVLREAGISLKESDELTITEGSSKTHVVIRRSQSISVNYAGSEFSAETFGTTVGDLLNEMDICLAEGDTVTSGGAPVSIAQETYDGMDIQIDSTDVKTRSELEPVPYETVTYMDPTLEAGTKEVQTPGIEGQQQLVYRDTYINGQLSDTELFSSKITLEPVDEVILVGCKEAPQEREIAVEIYVEPEPEPEPEPVPSYKPETGYTPEYNYTPEPEPEYNYTPEPEPEYKAPTYSGNTITTASGEVINYSYSLSVTATAYTGGGITATGTNARYGAIAVDPTVIPYGTRMYIVSDDGKYIYGYATAEDCGGAIKGNKIDLYFDSYDTCIQFGRRSCTVYILG